MTKEKEKSFVVEIAEALQEDIDKGIARMPSRILKKLRLVSGDTVEIKGKQATVIRVLRAPPRDESKDIIRIDGTTRTNISSSLGERITVMPLAVQPAASITLAPTQEVRFSNDPTEYFHTKLLDRPLALKQAIIIDVFGTRLRYTVTKTSPKGFCIVTPATKIIISDNVQSGDARATNVTYEDIGGLKNEIELIREMVELPMKHPEVFQKLGVGAPKGVLLTGPPGTGKTLIAKAVANEAKANFISVKGPELVSKWVGESEKHLREIFKKARQVAPTIIFFDEFDSIAKVRGSSLNDSTEKMVNQLLTEMDGVEELERVVVIAATNRKDLIDPALLRPGRFDAIVELSIPDKKTREKIFAVHTQNMPLDSSLNIAEYIEKTNWFNGAEIEAVCREAGIRTIKRM